MDSYKNLDIEKIIEGLDGQVFESTGKHLSKAEIAIIKGAWNGQDYQEIAANSGYNMHYLRTAVGPNLWTMLSEVIGDGVQIKKATVKNVLLEIVKKDYLNKNDSLIGKTKIYGELPKINLFYGREKEINYLKNQIKLFKHHCVYLFGSAGTGKTFVAAKIVEELLLEEPNSYDCVIWKSINYGSSLEDVLDEIIKVLNLKIENKSREFKLGLILDQLKIYRCLLILDGLEGLAQIEVFEKKIECGNLFRRLIEEQHQSCIIVTSQLPLDQIAYTATTLLPAYVQIQGLEENAAMQILRKKDLKGEKECKKLIKIYRANPSLLELVANRINKFFGGDISKFLDYKTTLISENILKMLNQQFGENGLLNDIQKQILLCLAEHTSEELPPLKFSDVINIIRGKNNCEISISNMMDAIEVLEQRCLIEINQKSAKDEVSYSLEPAIRKYILVDPLSLIYKNFNSSNNKLNGLKASNHIQE
ncbi:ATP-binding protein (plasmid) [Nostoc edaphicum CCNP1411]|uniref:ATP-binding protein n=1 Tax=Nostoc edaphicum CCNP1411 TaxID=1472755 RepID=A0A7D7LBL7_9NOSO|nr:ATP-binding protein [Nostoc edaphicum]QMS86452.1 ATP-binding protein [Nostoc edaphicum CCNP1411]